MHFDVGMFLSIFVVAEAVGLGIALVFTTQGGMYTAGKTIEGWRLRNFILGTVVFMFCVALAAGLSEPTATPAAAVAGGAGLVFLWIMILSRIGAPRVSTNSKEVDPLEQGD
jgi:hypothetical protein